MDLRLGNRTRRREKIEVAAFVGLADMGRIERAVAARVARRGLAPGGAASPRRCVRYVSAAPPGRARQAGLTGRRLLVDGGLVLRFFGDAPAECDEGGDLVVSELRHLHLARQRRLDVGRKLRVLLRLARSPAFLELRHHLGGEQLERLADVLVLVHPRLLDERDLIDARSLELAQMVA